MIQRGAGMLSLSLIDLIKFIGGIVSLPFYFGAMYLFFTKARDRYEKRGVFFTIGLTLIALSFVAEFLAHVYVIESFDILSNAVFGLAGISMVFSCYLSSKMLDQELTGGVA